ncbi:DNA-3-methyladenine glycosylase 2 family protein, partial [Clostridium tyrobutyricum]|uniref:DNA-3-methyladenine glycosylase family protein n=1 Tax=Clostridium tyrobutyricum TaxID=1519 RepID=UPI001DB0A2A5|nr:DNA-3-methyladenine glycosylase 2 family protein [Clostridium tyrobutyricum]
DENILRELGISKAKISYIKNLSKYLINEKLDLNKLSKLNDSEQIRNILISIRGIGPWTADMFLIFSLGKMDILSYRDVSIKRAVKWLYELDDTPDAIFTNKK